MATAPEPRLSSTDEHRGAKRKHGRGHTAAEWQSHDEYPYRVLFPGWWAFLSWAHLIFELLSLPTPTCETA